MSEGASPPAAAVPTSADTLPTPPDATKSDAQEGPVSNGTSNGNVGADADAFVIHSEAEVAKEVAADDRTSPKTTVDKQAASDVVTEDNPPATTTEEDIEMRDAEETTDAAAPAVDAPADSVDDTPAASGKSKARRKSVGVPEHKNKKLNKKGSMAKITHLDAKPGDYFLARLKGFPPWPCIICSEDMLPTTLLKARPVTAAREDGTYLEPYADGGPKAKDRTFPIMYLATNEFGWHVNTDLTDVDLDTIGDTPVSKKKDLKEAHQIAAEKHDLKYFKDMLIAHEESRKADEAAKEAAKEAKKAAKANKENRRKSKVTDDTDMPDAVGEEDPEAIEPKPKSKKRKADEDPNTSNGSESAKKTKVTIKVKTNGTDTATPKSAKAAKEKVPSAKPKKTKKEVKETIEAPPKEVELTPEEKRQKKEKEILFLRHKLQKGLLTKDQEPKEEEMKAMSEFVTKLEGYVELEGSIIRATKINKVLKAILKLTSIPKEEEFHFKPRSQTLLDRWNKLLASEQDTPAQAQPNATNGVSDEGKKSEEVKTNEVTNGLKDSPEEDKNEEKSEKSLKSEKLDDKPEVRAEAVPTAESETETSNATEPGSKEIPKAADAPNVEEAPEAAPEATAVESTA